MQHLTSSTTKLVIFDWDGTLMDSVGQIVSCLLQAATHHQLPLTADAAQDIIGLGLPEAMRVLFPNHDALHADIIATYARYFVSTADQAYFFAGVTDLLDWLQAQQIQIAVATGKSRIGLERVMTQTQSQSRFAITRCASETASKPNPMMLQEILDATGYTAAECIMVGDSVYDLDMAERIGMPRIGVTYGVHDTSRLRAFAPIAIVDDIVALKASLAQYIKQPLS